MTRAKARVHAALSADKSTYTIKGVRWGETLPVGMLPSRLAMYQKLAARKGGAYAHHYAQSIKAMERLAGILGTQE